MLRGFKYRFYPTPEQESLLRRTIGCARLVYNKALAERSAAWAQAKKSIGYATQCRSLTSWKRSAELTFLNDVSSVALQQSLRHLQAAYVNFFQKRARYPSFKRKSAGGSAVFVRGAFSLREGQLRLAKMSSALKIRWSRPLPGNTKPTRVTASVDAAGRWHVAILCEDLTVKRLPGLKNAIGIDLGITALATLSTGEKIPNLRHDETEIARKRRLSRSLARKKKGSHNRYKAQQKLARLHARIADRRKDSLHKLSTRLVRENQVIAVEDLNIAGMIRNRSLARVISDAGWRQLLFMLAYKCNWYGRDFVKVDRYFPSSKTCHSCGVVVEALPLSIREWKCKACGTSHDRDVNAAKNVLAAGHAVAIACGPGVRHRILRNQVLLGLKQEPPMAGCQIDGSRVCASC